MAYKGYWSEERQKFIFPGSGQPRGKTIKIANTIRLCWETKQTIDEMKWERERRQEDLKRARSCTAAKDRYIYNKVTGKFDLRIAMRSRIPEIQARIAELDKSIKENENYLEKLTWRLHWARRGVEDDKMTALMLCNKPSEINKRFKKKAKEEGKYYFGGRQVKDEDIY